MNVVLHCVLVFGTDKRDHRPLIYLEIHTHASLEISLLVKSRVGTSTHQKVVKRLEKEKRLVGLWPVNLNCKHNIYNCTNRSVL